MITRDMPLHVKVQLRDVDGDWTIPGNELEKNVLIEASRLGFEVEEEYNSPSSKTEPSAFCHNVKVVKHEVDKKGRDIQYFAWLHFNHPSHEYQNSRGEWFWYIM